MTKETYVEPEITSRPLEAEAMGTNLSGGGDDDGTYGNTVT